MIASSTAPSTPTRVASSASASSSAPSNPSSSPRQHAYQQLCRDVIAHPGLNKEYLDSLHEVCTLHRTSKREQWQLFMDIKYVCQDDAKDKSLMTILLPELQTRLKELPENIIRMISDRSGKLNAIQPVDVIQQRFEAHLSQASEQRQRKRKQRDSNGLSPDAQSDCDTADTTIDPNAFQLTEEQCIDLFIRLAFSPARTSGPIEVRVAEEQVQKAFATAFRGPAVKRLLAHLAILSQRDFGSESRQDSSTATPTQKSILPYYARVVPILQSSGFGKTKLCVHLSAQQAGLLICLRHETKSIVTSFPPQDAVPYSYLTKCSGDFERKEREALDVADNARRLEQLTKADLDVDRRLACFLAAYCRVLAEKLNSIARISGCFEPGSELHPHGVAHTRAKHTNQIDCWKSTVFALAASLHRKGDFLKELELSYDENLESFYQDLADKDEGLRSDSARRNMLEAIDATATDLLEEAKAYDNTQSLADKIIRPDLVSLEQLAERQGLDPAEAIFFLALDECGAIAKILPHLRRLWNHAEPKRSWIFLIDTNSNIAPLAGSLAITSARLMFGTGTHQLATAFTSMPFDVHVTADVSRTLNANLQAGTCLHEQLESLIPKLGRPLWNDKIPFRDLDDILDCRAIVAKLIGSYSWRWPEGMLESNPPKGLDVEAVDFQNIMALAFQRVPLGQAPHSAMQLWQNFVKNQVSNRLRVVRRVHPSTDVIESHTSSEPPLSIASAWYFRRAPSKIAVNWSLTLTTLVHARQAIGLNVGLEGEEGVHLLCSMATDLAAGKRYESQFAKLGQDDKAQAVSDKHACVMGLITIRDWLDVLLGRDRIKFADDSSKEADSNFDAWCSRQWINFKHIGDLAKQIRPETKHRKAESLDRGLLAQFWLRHAAIRGVTNQAGWDLLIPIYDSYVKPTGKTRFELDRLSYIAVQVKNTVKAPEFPAVLGPDLQDTGKSDQSKACLELFLDLRGPIVGFSSLKSTVEPADLATGKMELTRYNIYVSGLDERCYPLLSKLDQRVRSEAAVLFGLSALGTNQFDHDLAQYMCQLGQAQEDELIQARQQLDVAEGKCPFIEGIPMQDPPKPLDRPKDRLFPKGHRMHTLSH